MRLYNTKRRTFNSLRHIFFNLEWVNYFQKIWKIESTFNKKISPPNLEKKKKKKKINKYAISLQNLSSNGC